MRLLSTPLRTGCSTEGWTTSPPLRANHARHEHAVHVHPATPARSGAAEPSSTSSLGLRAGDVPMALRGNLRLLSGLSRWRLDHHAAYDRLIRNRHRPWI